MKWILAVGLLSCSVAMAQQQSDILSVSASANAENAALAFDRNVKTMWTIPSQALKAEQWLMFTIQQPGDVCELDLQMQGINKNKLKEVLDIFVTYDPMNLGTPVNYRIEGPIEAGFCQYFFYGKNHLCDLHIRMNQLFSLQLYCRWFFLFIFGNFGRIIL